ncbi:MAG: hypothetical protein K2W95_16275 [Candidatus Obscuribacterales bacterium]|nr:hypothetical protein [Candidatus Obscuribacterales bacterium]
MRNCRLGKEETMLRIIAILGLLLFASTAPTFAQVNRDAQLAEASKAYARNDFAKSRDILEQLTVSYPKDPIVHYLLGNSYLAVSKFELAEREYQLCLKLNPPLIAVAQCQQALGRIRVYMSTRSAASSAQATSAQPATYPGASTAAATTGQAPLDPNLALNEQKLAEQQQELIRRADMEQARMTEHHKRICDAQTSRIKEQAEFEISQLQKYTYTSRGRQITNPHYEEEARAIREDADRRIKSALDALERNSSTLGRTGDRTRNDIAAMASNLREAAQSDKGSSRLMPNGSNLYTKNYVNFGDEIEREPEPPRPVEALKADYAKVTVKPKGSGKP